MSAFKRRSVHGVRHEVTNTFCCRFDLVWDVAGPVQVHPNMPTMLGCSIPDSRTSDYHS